ncbi:hypothetical protein WA158_000513 [Blastocystis sp. Blastoise]
MDYQTTIQLNQIRLDEDQPEERIQDVWDYNFEEEFLHIIKMAAKYPYIAMDTEFPGVLTINTDRYNIFSYKTLRDNVNQLKLIQLGITFCDKDGLIATDCPTWQFNFKFNVNTDKHKEQSIQLLKDAGINFDYFSQYGLDPLYFAEMMTMSGLLLNSRLSWISFHSGYDFGYLVKLFTNNNLPETQEEFFQLLNILFPKLYDIKHIITECDGYKGSLEKLADLLHIHRRGKKHQAGSDSIVTAQIFFSLQTDVLHGTVDDKFLGVLHGVADDSYFAPMASTPTSNTN